MSSSKGWYTQAEMEGKARHKLDRELRRLCKKPKRTRNEDREIVECLAMAGKLGMNTRPYIQLLAKEVRAA